MLLKILTNKLFLGRMGVRQQPQHKICCLWVKTCVHALPQWCYGHKAHQETVWRGQMHMSAIKKTGSKKDIEKKYTKKTTL